MAGRCQKFDYGREGNLRHYHQVCLPIVGYFSFIRLWNDENIKWYNHVYPGFFENVDFFFSVLAFRLHVNGVFGNQKRCYNIENCPRSGVS